VPGPLLLGIGDLSLMLRRSIPSLHRDDAAGRLPAALRIGGSKRWRASDITEWVELGCPTRPDFEALRRRRR
jgi:predicted DNA-binding transcriptional regulator AlpA